MDITARIAKFAAGTKYELIPDKAVQTAQMAIVDCLGVTLAGSREQSAKICGEVARQEYAREEATVIGQRFKSSVLEAAFANGTAAHALDFDHSFTLMGQPTAPIIPAAFSLGESLGVGGRQLLEAYILGFEVTAKLVFSLRNATQDTWHGPSSLGVFGATVACAKLLGLNSSQTEMALGIATSMAGGVVANFGTMTKPLHVGLAARNGLLAAKLAHEGFTSNPKAIETAAGFYDVLYHGSPVDGAPLEELGQSYALDTEGIRIKAYPCGGLLHPAIDATLELCAKHGITAEMIHSMVGGVTQHTYNRIVFRLPETGLQGKFSMNYVLARTVIDRKVSLSHFTDEAVGDRNVLSLAEKVQMQVDPSLRATNAGGRPCKVTIRLQDGQTYSRELEYAKGSPENPMTAQELRQKFTECALRAIDEPSVSRALDYLQQLDALGDIRQLGALLAG